MATSPCNSLNVKTIRFSQLASVSATNLNSGDVIYISQYDSVNNVYYSKKTTLSDLTEYLSIQASVTGSFSGSYWGRINSKNTKATGSFNGILYGTAINSNTSSYLLQTAQNTTSEVGYFNGTRLKSATGLTFIDNDSGYKKLKLSSSLPFNYVEMASRGVKSGGAPYNQSGVAMYNLNSSDAYPMWDGWTILSNVSGSLVFTSPIGSYEFSSSNIVAKSTSTECYGMVQKRNGFYFWPYMASNTPARDGAIGIGVQPPNEPTGSFDKYLRAKLQINCFSGSGEGGWSPTATVENRSTAILVQYGSGSFNTTFYVSASGNTYVGGTLSVNKALTSSLTPTGTGTSLPANVKWIPIKVGNTVYKLPLYN
jgi:hypothetical protein